MNQNKRGHALVFLFLLACLAFVIVGGVIDFMNGGKV